MVDAKKIKHDLSESEESQDGQEKKPEEVEQKDEVFSDLLPLLPSSTPQQEVEQALGLSMPQDFYSMWRFAKSVEPSKPLQCLASVGLKLCGAFEVLGGLPEGAPRSKGLLLSHHRYAGLPPGSDI